MTLILDEAFYSSIGAALFPVQPGSKLPFPGFEWKSAASADPAQWRKWATEFPGCNWALYARGSGLVIVDVDVKNVGESQAWQVWQDIRRQCNIADGEPNVKTPTGGWHVYLSVEDEAQISQAPLVRGVIDIRHEGYTIVPPSVVDGKPYLRYPVAAIHAATPALLDRVSRSNEPAARAAPAVFAIDDIRSRLSFLVSTGYFDDEPTWTASVWAIKRAFGDAGYPLAQFISYRDEQNRLPSVWAREGDRGSRPTTCATLIKDSNAAGFREHQRANMFANAPVVAASPPIAASLLAQEYLLDSAAFVRGFVPPDYLVDGIFQRGYLYTITAKTGVGKTAVAMRFGAHVAVGRNLGDLEVSQGTVLYLAGENPTDIRMRFLGLSKAMGIEPDRAPMHFVDGVVALSQTAEQITAEIARKGLSLALVVVDTAAAFNEGDDENSNAQAGEYARRLRSLTNLPGNPCVIVLAHPAKNASDEEMVPRGGSAFLNEVDGNIGLRKKDATIAASVAGKFRGPEFPPVHFELITMRDHPKLRDARSRQIPTVVARPISADEQSRLDQRGRDDDDAILKLLCDRPGLNPTDIARALEWFLRAVNGKEPAPYHAKAARRLEALEKQKLVEQRRGGWFATAKAQRDINSVEAIRK